jgi:uncharacterized membrane protein
VRGVCATSQTIDHPIMRPRFSNQEESIMKNRLITAAIAATLLTAASVASAQQMYYRTAQVPGQDTPNTYSTSQMDQGAPMQSQSGDTSYGGVSMDSRSAMGGSDSPASKPCVRGSNCNIFFGQ